MKGKPIEQQVDEVIFSRPVIVEIGADSYECPRPTIGTLIEVSSLIGRMPANTNREDIAVSSLRIARDCDVIGDIFAVLLRGGKKRISLIERMRRNRIKKRILYKYTPTELMIAMSSLLKTLDISGFFALTTFLSGVNVTKPTKVV